MENFLFNRVVAQIEGWMSTYFCPPLDGSGGIGGPIATYWASSPYVAGPYIMNSYGLIRGLCARAGDDTDGKARLRAERLALYYLRCQDPTTGIFVCSWGEDPFIGYGLVQQASVVCALWDLHRVWPNPEVARAASRCWQACLHHPWLRDSWAVYNQALRCCEALILGIRARGDDKPNAAEKALLQRVGRQVAEAQWGDDSPYPGALAQALTDDKIIMPYQGKCLHPLVLLAKVLDTNQYLEIARRLADFILRNLEEEGGSRLLQGQYLPEGENFIKAKRLYRLRRLLPFLEASLRRHRRKGIGGWRFIPWPKWIARSLDTARGLNHLGRALGEAHYINVAMDMAQAVLRHQSPLGGLRNTMGFFGEDPETLGGAVWQDKIPIPRWNSYAIQFFHELAVGTPLLEPIKPEPQVTDVAILAGNLKLRETSRELCLVDDDDRLLWRIRKGHHWGRPFSGITKGEGGAFTGRLVLGKI